MCAQYIFSFSIYMWVEKVSPHISLFIHLLSRYIGNRNKINATSKQEREREREEKDEENIEINYENTTSFMCDTNKPKHFSNIWNKTKNKKWTWTWAQEWIRTLFIWERCVRKPSAGISNAIFFFNCLFWGYEIPPVTIIKVVTAHQNHCSNYKGKRCWTGEREKNRMGFGWIRSKGLGETNKSIMSEKKAKQNK